MDTKFPEVLYVKREVDGDNSFLIADDDSAGLAELGADIPVAVYRLETKGILASHVEFQPTETPAAPKKTRAKKADGNKTVEVNRGAESMHQNGILSQAEPAPSVTTGEAVPPAKTQADAQAALEKLFASKGMEICREVMSRFGVQRLKDLKPEQYADFVAHVETVLAGGKV